MLTKMNRQAIRRCRTELRRPRHEGGGHRQMIPLRFSEGCSTFSAGRKASGLRRARKLSGFDFIIHQVVLRWLSECQHDVRPFSLYRLRLENLRHHVLCRAEAPCEYRAPDKRGGGSARTTSAVLRALDRLTSASVGKESDNENVSDDGDL